MERADWMSERGYQSGLEAERKLAIILKRQEREDRRLDEWADQLWTSTMVVLVGLGWLGGFVFVLGTASAHAGALDLLGMDGQRAVQESGAGWRVWLGGAIATGVLALLAAAFMNGLRTLKGLQRTA